MSREQVQRAADQVRADPNLGQVKHERTLQFKKLSPDADKPDKPRDKKKTPAEKPPAWLVDFAHWLTDSGHVFVWVLGVILVAFVVATAHRWMRVRGAVQSNRALNALPSHVRDLDIRPQSLPESVGDAARALWLRGAQREALSLLYRGMLSKLVHAHGAPIRAASTEGECVRLTHGHVGPACSEYVNELVRAWQLAVYGGRMPDATVALSLCDAFEARMTPPAATPMPMLSEARA